MTLSPEHAAYLEAHAVNLELAERLGVRSVASQGDLAEELREEFAPYLPGILYPWFGPYGAEAPQLRPDEPTVGLDGRLKKYRFVKGQAPVLWPVRPVPDATTILIEEGTKQCLCAAQYAPPDIAVYGVAGCENWTKNKIPIKDLAIVDGKHVLVAFDADAGTNLNVYNAGVRFAAALKAEGALSVKWVRLPAGGTAGLDDVLSKRAPDRRADYLARLIADARDKIADRKPQVSRKRTSDGAAFFDENGLMARKLAEAVLAKAPSALTQENVIAMYGDGVYSANGSRFIHTVVQLLGNDYRPGHRRTAEDVASSILYEQGRRLPSHVDEPLLNLRNGLLHLPTSELRPHTPEHLSAVQLPVEWDPTATCPHYETWLHEVVPGQIDDLEETASTMLDPSRTPPKALFLFGPSRSGKSTFLRILSGLVGPQHRAAVTLHQLGKDSFAAANLYLTILNAAADLSSADVNDISTFKMLTGEDSVHANRKYGGQFHFTNRALFAFSANEVPTVGESSRAYAERIKPFGFDYSFAGRENPAVENEIMKELPGVLVRLVRAWQRLTERGSYLPTETHIRTSFDGASDRVRLWLSEMCRVVPAYHGQKVPATAMTTKRELSRCFNTWAQDQYAQPMGERKIVERLTSVDGVVEVRGPSRVRGLNIAIGRLFEADDDEIEEARRGNGAVPATPLREALCATSHGREVDLEEVGGVLTKGGSGNRPNALVARPEGAIVFDLETGDADKLYKYGPGFVRLGGFQVDGVYERTTDFDGLSERLQAAPLVVGHNILGFDFQALSRYHGLRIGPLVAADRVRDTILMARHLNPPKARQRGGYSLDALAKEYIDPEAGKTHDLKELAKLHGGFDKIPVDDEDYNTYQRGDVELNAQLYAVLDAKLQEKGSRAVDYVRREHRVAAIAAQISLNGFRVDLDVLDEQVKRNDKIRQKALAVLHEHYGIPLVDEKDKPYAAPLATKAGKLALIKALVERGVKTWWTTGAKGDIVTGAEAMQQMALQHMDKPEVREICKLVIGVVGLRSVYITVQKNLVGKDRVHCRVSMGQSTGRWSLSKPGLTVMGKRGGRWRERNMFIAEPGHVVIAIDLSQVDMRAIAGLSGDRAYIDMLRHEDPHGEIARLLFGDPKEREIAKPIGHGWNYGRSLKAISFANEIKPDKVMQFDREMRDRFPRLVAWREEVRDKAAAGEWLDNGFGRMMHPDRSRAHTQGPALMGQGCARDIMMEGLLRLPEECHQYLRAQVHDEIVLSVPKDDAVEIQQTVIDALSFDWNSPSGEIVPIVAEGGPTDRTSWGQVYAK